jgi:hypothetical protein
MKTLCRIAGTGKRGGEEKKKEKNKKKIVCKFTSAAACQV